MQPHLDHLKEQYGYNSFRSGQYEIISDILAGDNVLAVLPTGGGKSLLYQFPATFQKKTALVVSPLLSLMADQCAGLMAKGITCSRLSGTETKCKGSSECSCAFCNLVRGDEVPRLMYVTPEWLTSRAHKICQIKNRIALVAIDEAHCISQWSHDFRPSYRELARPISCLGDVPLLAVTATATPRVLTDIYDVLDLPAVAEYFLGTRRSNLAIQVKSKLSWDPILSVPDSGGTIVYTNTCNAADEIGSALKNAGRQVGVYHAKLSQNARDAVHREFLEGSIDVVVATIAFGMGIDKSDIRHVINVGVPTDIETYYQEIGRAGRDGLDCQATLYWESKDFATAKWLIGQGAETQKQRRFSALRLMEAYINDRVSCRQVLIDRYFETGTLRGGTSSRCGICDNCKRSDARTIDVSSIAERIRLAVASRSHPTGISKTIKLCSKFAPSSQLKWLIPTLVERGILVVNRNTKWGDLYSAGSKATEPICVQEPTMISGGRTSRLAPVRQKLANDLGVAPTQIMSDSVLASIESRAPRTVTELWNIDGVSSDFVATHGELWLRLQKKAFRKTAK